ncbi:MAG: hypothetical protein EZS28_020772 [Streblomastix strix]|uniref:RNase H type-1 domain-containing protein n=1 Tax=Streblomastix strix TaxID=222440 RepID=A0A5J4VMB3_9EUKA|nr:MAG: hypothetical protein EZS28_020772 [Streblomastix strix]
MVKRKQENPKLETQSYSNVSTRRHQYERIKVKRYSDCWGRRCEMVQSYICIPLERQRQVEEDHGLPITELTPSMQTFQNGRHSYIAGADKTIGLGYKDRFRECVQPHNNLKKPQTILRLQVQRQMIHLQGYVFRHPPCNTGVLQDNATCDGVHSQNYSNQRRIILRPFSVHEQFKRRNSTGNGIITKSFENIRLESVSRKVSASANTAIRVPWTVIQHKEQLAMRDQSQKIRDISPSIEIEKINRICQDCSDKMICKTDKGAKLFEIVDQERWSIFEKDEQVEVSSIKSKELDKPNVNIQINTIRNQLKRLNYSGRNNQSVINKSGDHTGGRMVEGVDIKSSNQRETAAIHFVLQDLGKIFQNGQIKSVSIQSYNSNAVFNINRRAAVPALASLVDRILQEAEHLQLQISAFHIPGKENVIADLLSGLAISGDYEIRKEVLQEALSHLYIRPTIDIFANRRNRKCKRFCSLIWDQWAETQDGFKMSWRKEAPLQHPPILLIQRVINKIMKDQIEGVLIVPNWQAQELNSYVKASLSARRFVDYKIQGSRREEIYSLIAKQRGIDEQAVNSSIQRWNAIWRRHRQRLVEFRQYWEELGHRWEDLRSIQDSEAKIINYILNLKSKNASSNNIVENVAAVSLLFKVAGIQAS